MEPRTNGDAAIFPTRAVNSGSSPSASAVPCDEALSGESVAGALLMESLPPPNTKRWVVRRKAAVLAAVRSGGITIEEACRAYQLSKEELLSWQRAFEIHGLAGLRTTRVQQYRRVRQATVPFEVAEPTN